MTPERASRRRLWRLHTKLSVEHETPILSLEGRLGHTAVAELEMAVGQLVAGAPAFIILDLSGVDYLSSAALRVFETLADSQSRKGGRLLLRAPSVAARLAIELAGLTALVNIES